MLEDTIDRYCEAWNESDPVRRERLLQEVLADDAIYVDPRGKAVGVAELSNLIATVTSKRPGARLMRTGPADAHHGYARFGWRVVRADGVPLPESVDFVEFSAEGKLRRIVGFFGPLPTDTRA